MYVCAVVTPFLHRPNSRFLLLCTLLPNQKWWKKIIRNFESYSLSAFLVAAPLPLHRVFRCFGCISFHFAKINTYIFLKGILHGECIGKIRLVPNKYFSKTSHKIFCYFFVFYRVFIFLPCLILPFFYWDIYRIEARLSLLRTQCLSDARVNRQKLKISFDGAFWMENKSE